jgi:hypothetical protein
VARLIQLFGRVEAADLLEGGTHPMMTLFRAQPELRSAVVR